MTSGVAWHTLDADRVVQSEGVDGQRGLSSAEAAARVRRFGPNMFAAGRAESRWQAFLRQYHDPMQLVLLAAGLGSLYPLKQARVRRDGQLAEIPAGQLVRGRRVRADRGEPARSQGHRAGGGRRHGAG